MATVPLVYGRGRISNSWRKTLPFFFEPGSGKIWWLKKVQYPQKSTVAGPPAWRETQVDFSQYRQSFASTGISTSLASGSYRMASTHSSWRLHIKSKSDTSYARRSSIGQELDQGPTQGVEATEPYVGHQEVPIYRQFTVKSNCRRPLRH